MGGIENGVEDTKQPLGSDALRMVGETAIDDSQILQAIPSPALSEFDMNNYGVWVEL